MNSKDRNELAKAPPMNAKNRISPFTGMLIMLVMILVMMVIHTKVPSPVLRSLIAVGICGGLVLLVLVTKRICAARNPPVERRDT
jgi:hypothetical protein